MAISRGLEGYGALVSDLAQNAVEAVAAGKARDIAAQLQMNREEQISRQKIAEMENQFQMARMQLGYQMELEKEGRAQQWDIEKMEIASRLDFEKEEKTRRQKQDQFELKEKALKDAISIGTIDKDTGERELRALEYEKIGAEGLAQSVMRPKTKDELMYGNLKPKIGDTSTGTVTGTPKAPSPEYTGLIVTDTGPALIKPDGSVEPINRSTTYIVRDENNEIQHVTGQSLMQKDPKTGDYEYKNVTEWAGTIKPVAPGTPPKSQQELINKFGPRAMKEITAISDFTVLGQPQKTIEEAAKIYAERKEKEEKGKTIRQAKKTMIPEFGYGFGY